MIKIISTLSFVIWVHRFDLTTTTKKKKKVSLSDWYTVINLRFVIWLLMTCFFFLLKLLKWIIRIIRRQSDHPMVVAVMHFNLFMLIYFFTKKKLLTKYENLCLNFNWTKGKTRKRTYYSLGDLNFNQINSSIN